MKLKVISAFIDRDDHVTVYDPETILEVKDKDRAQSLIDRDLCKEYKGKAAAAYTLGEAEDSELPNTGEGTEETPGTGSAEETPNPQTEGDE